ncbi:hypothetical protein [Porcipelethomonas sp.]|uniref:hypothetical protein n=1 Tax=Porcipelethomonas sp. TaxID=2981675 RepID=UPI003EFADDF1
MLKKTKRILSGIIASALLLTCAGCGVGKSTAYALTIDGYQVKAGVYIYYQYAALQEAKNLAKEADSEIDTEDEKALKKTTIQGKEFLKWVEDKAIANCSEHVAVLKHFDEMELSLSDEDMDSIDSYVESAYENNPVMFEGNGIGEESLKEVMTSTYKSQEIFEALYGEGGSEGIKEDDIKDYYIENNARVKYVGLDLHDAEGNDLDEAGKKEITDMADDFLKRAKNAGSEEAMLEEFDTMQEEYDKYVSDKAAEAAGEETTTQAATEETTEEVTEAPSETTEYEADINEDEAETDSDEEEASEESDENESAEETTTAVSESDEEAETTTTVDPYANETIIAVVTTDENTKEEDVTYNPSKIFYDWVYNDAKTGVPEIVEDEDTIYVAVRLDITERMTDDDLWSENSIENTRFSMFSDDLQDKLDEWVDEYEVVRNEKAIKRYDPFAIKTDSE